MTRASALLQSHAGIDAPNQLGLIASSLAAKIHERKSGYSTTFASTGLPSIHVARNASEAVSSSTGDKLTGGDDLDDDRRLAMPYGSSSVAIH